MTTIDPEELAALTTLLRTDYDYPSAVEIELIRDGQAGNRTYHVRSDGRPTILRVYGSSWRGREDRILFELELLTHLQSRDIPVSAPISCANGELLGHVALVPDDLRPCALFTLAEGHGSWPLATGPSERLGATMAALHRAADSYPVVRDHALYDIENLVDIPVARMQRYISDQADADDLEQLAARIRKAIAQIPADNGAYGAIHGDMHQGNCHFTPDGAVTLFDFSLCGVGWRGFDTTGFLWPMRDHHYAQEAIHASCDAYLAGYQSVRPMHPAELAAIPAFVKVRDLWEKGNWIEVAPETDPATFAEGMRVVMARFRAYPLP